MTPFVAIKRSRSKAVLSMCVVAAGCVHHSLNAGAARQQVPASLTVDVCFLEEPDTPIRGAWVRLINAAGDTLNQKVDTGAT